LGDAWQPCTTQSESGMSMFLSCLYVFSATLRNMKSTRQEVLGYWNKLCDFPPAVMALHQIISANTKHFNDCSKACLANMFYYLLAG
jgi:hypothetical protein